MLEKTLAKYDKENNSYAPFARLRQDFKDQITHYQEYIKQLEK